MKQVIAYYRVSTKDQNLGIDAQKSMVKHYCEFNSAEIVAEYEEHESGKKNNRPILATALAECSRTGTHLIVAKIDRLTRVAYFGLQLCEKYKIIFCDHPTMGTLEQSIYFGMAQQEREYISQRTKAALSVLKQQGKKLGAPNPTFTDEQRSLSLRRRRYNCLNNEDNKRAYAVIGMMNGVSLNKQASFLNQNGFLTAKGKKWTANQVKRLITSFSSI